MYHAPFSNAFNSLSFRLLVFGLFAIVITSQIPLEVLCFRENRILASAAGSSHFLRRLRFHFSYGSQTQPKTGFKSAREYLQRERGRRRLMTIFVTVNVIG